MSDYPYDLGHYTRPITTTSNDAQKWFDRGLNWTFGYHHEEAGLCFEHALEADPHCVMAHWGLAYIAGPNYNNPWELFPPEDLVEALTTARAALSAAKAAISNATPVEKALLSALEKRYQSDEPVPDLYVWSAAYADAMRKVHQDFNDDSDVASLFAESMMNRTPWQMWNPVSGEPMPGADTLECRAVLERCINKVRAEGNLPHPGTWHLYLHLMEMSPTPEVALIVADEIRELVPSAGHLAHMATHIDVLCGNYQDVVKWNHKGILADEIYWRNSGAMNFYSMYRVHNYHFKLYGAMFLGQFDAAMDAIEGMNRTIPNELITMETPPMVNWLEGYMSIETHALVRFGRWQQLIDAPLPEDQDVYRMTTAMNYYGKGVAHAALKQHAKADEARTKFSEIAATMPEERMVHVVTCQQILDVAKEMLAGEIEYHKGNFDVAFKHLRQAVINEDALPYDEPWGWMMPSRHALGALLLEQGHTKEAAAAYEADLGLNDACIRSNRHPNNVWALLGLHKCYEQLDRTKEAAMIKPALDFALARADKEIYSSCFCSSNKETM